MWPIMTLKGRQSEVKDVRCLYMKKGLTVVGLVKSIGRL